MWDSKANKSVSEEVALRLTVGFFSGVAMLAITSVLAGIFYSMQIGI